jgi:hypothetical protein
MPHINFTIERIEHIMSKPSPRVVDAILGIALLVQIGVDLWFAWLLLIAWSPAGYLVGLLGVPIACVFVGRLRVRARLRAAISA